MANDDDQAKMQPPDVCLPMTDGTARQSVHGRAQACPHERSTNRREPGEVIMTKDQHVPASACAISFEELTADLCAGWRAHMLALQRSINESNKATDSPFQNLAWPPGHKARTTGLPKGAGFCVSIPFDVTFHIDQGNRARALRFQTRAQDFYARAGRTAPTAVMSEKTSIEFFADYETADQFAYPQWRESFTQRASRASSPPAHPMKDSPTGEPACDPMGRVT